MEAPEGGATYMESVDSVAEADPKWWHLAYFHEAGHAVAALRRNRPVNDIYIHPDNGFTSHGFDDTYEGDAHQFIVYAGPWAEVRALWAFNGINKNADDAAREKFADTVRDLLRKNGSDWLEYHRAMGRDYDESHRGQARAVYDLNGDRVPPDEDPPHESWDALFDEMWPEMRWLGLRMLSGQTQITVGNDTLLRVARGRWIRPLP
jgi:hypothetical protein